MPKCGKNPQKSQRFTEEGGTNDPTAKTPGIKKNAYVLFKKLRSEMGEKDRSTRALRPTTSKKPEDSLESSGFALLKEGGFLLSRIALQYHRRHWA